MKFSILVMMLNKSVSQLTSVAGGPSSGKDDISYNVYIEATKDKLTLKATDYNIEVTTTLDLVGDVVEGSTTVNISKLAQALSKMPQNELVSFDLLEDELTLSSATTVFKLRTRNAVEFPTFETEEETSHLVISQKKLKSILDRSIFCISSEDFREYLKGLRIEADADVMSVFTSDGHRMAILETRLDEPVPSFIGISIRKKCAVELSRILNSPSDANVTLSFSANNFVTQIDNTRITSKLLICGYPNVRAVIPKVYTSYPVPRQLLKDLISSVSILSSKRLNGVTMNFEATQLSLRSENSENEVATATLEIENPNDPVEISLNATYVNETLNVIATDKVNFCFTQPISSALIEADDALNDPLGIYARYIISRVVV